MAPPTLLDIATRAAIQYCANIDDFADMPYSLIEPVLKWIDSPDQLHRIELNCPQVAKADRKLWIDFLHRYVPGWEMKFASASDLECIDYDLYCRLLALKKQDEDRAKEALQKEMQALGSKKKLNETYIINKPLPSVEYEGGRRLIPDRFQKDANARQRPSLASQRNGLAAIRRQVAAESAASRHAQRAMRNLTVEERLRNAKAQIKQAPREMVADLLPSASRNKYMASTPAPHPTRVPVVAPRIFGADGKRDSDQRNMARANRIIEEDRLRIEKETASRVNKTSPHTPIIASPAKGISASSPPPAGAKKRAVSSVFMPTKKRKG